jgi:hypothetical protein
VALLDAAAAGSTHHDVSVIAGCVWLQHCNNMLISLNILRLSCTCLSCRGTTAADPHCAWSAAGTTAVVAGTNLPPDSSCYSPHLVRIAAAAC